ncbi:ATP-binding protein [Streptomyces sp. NPDC057694]|uniref:ATP-binding protein n=1 Tax=Streptomyces sp. NPDC057694 TaxID=3346216 RepID=UPI0036B18AE1
MTAPIRPPVRPAALTLLAALLVTGALGAGAVALAPGSVRTPLAWGVAAAALAIGAAACYAAYARETVALLRRRADQTRHTTERAAAEQARITAELSQERDARAAQAAELTGQLRTARAERAAAIAACANAAGRMQALATGMLADLREMEHRHSDEDVLADLLHLDHRTAQAGRLADSVAVLTGARSGRRWARPIAMESILRGAMGRIGGYQRVRVHANTSVAVAGHAAEGVMHALAELLDNAANFSPPTAEVHVYVEEVPAGVIVSVEDSGLVMGPVQLRRAEHAVSGETAGPAGSAGSTGLGGLSGTRLGLAVVGRLARKHGLTVSFRPSARGGTGVLLLVPQELLSRTAEPTPVRAAGNGTTSADVSPAHETADATAPGPSARDRETVPERTATADAARGQAATEATAPERAAAEETAPEQPLPATLLSDGALPKRTRGRTLASARHGRDRAAEPPAARPGPAAGASAASRFSSFSQAVRTTTAAPDPAAARTDTRSTTHPDTPPQEGDTPQ